jgi:hypothetical protein
MLRHPGRDRTGEIMTIETEKKPGLPVDMRTLAIGGAVAVVLIVAVAAYFIWGGSHEGSSTASGGHVTVAHTGDEGLVQAANEAASAETGALCDRALTRARSFGAIPDSTTLTDAKETATQTQDSFTCKAKSADGAPYTITVNQVCDDLADHSCIQLQAVTQADGSTLFERQM